MVEVTWRVNAVVQSVEYIVRSLHAKTSIERANTVFSLRFHETWGCHRLPSLSNLW